ncbi:MAG: hypothetical protein M1457_11025 [bacterium]|nr:hypothetical protein [bacterium]
METRSGGKPKSKVQMGVAILESIGFAAAIAACWLTELFDPPFSLSQLFIETGVIAIVGVFTVRWSWHAIKQIRYLEGFLVICAACKSVKVDDRWVGIEAMLRNEPDLRFSHSICPACAKKLYGANLRG